MIGTRMLWWAVVFPVFIGIMQSVSAQPSASLDDLVERDECERIATGFNFTEGPLWHPVGYLLFTDIPGNSIHRWTPDGKVTTFRSPSGYSNGLTFDRQGRLIACEHSNRRVSRTEADGTITTLAGNYEGKKLNSPNDAVVKSDGSIYFTDPTYGLREPFGISAKAELWFTGVYRITPDGKKLDLLADDIPMPNGLAFSPDEKVLYVAGGYNILAFDVLPIGTLANPRVFAYGIAPDGIKVDSRGNLYVATGSLAVRVYDENGKDLGRIHIPESTTNCAFGGPENKTLFVTAGGSVYRIQLKVPGAPAATVGQSE